MSEGCAGHNAPLDQGPGGRLRAVVGVLMIKTPAGAVGISQSPFAFALFTNRKPAKWKTRILSPRYTPFRTSKNSPRKRSNGVLAVFYRTARQSQRWNTGATIALQPSLRRMTT